jgi:hypothetical protein
MPLDMSKRQGALADLAARLAFIQKDKGYNTDAGLKIFKGEWPRAGKDDAPAALVISVGDDAPSTTGGSTRSETPIEVWAIVPVGTKDPLDAIEEIIADIKEAVEGSNDDENVSPSRDRFFAVVVEGQLIGTLPKGVRRGITRGMRRPDGSDYVGACVEYLAAFEEAWGHP